jgi:hypothetical protein
LRYLSLINTWGVTVYPLKRNLVPRFDTRLEETKVGEEWCRIGDVSVVVGAIFDGFIVVVTLGMLF